MKWPEATVVLIMRDGYQESLQSCFGTLNHIYVKEGVPTIRISADGQEIFTKAVTVQNSSDDWICK